MTTTHRTPHLLARLTFSAAILVGTAGCGGDAEQAGEDPTPAGTTTASPGPSPSDSETQTPSLEPTEEPTPELIAYAGGESPGAEIQEPADLTSLTGAPASFVRFIGQAVTDLRAESDCDGDFVGVTVDFLRTDGYAAGGVNDCGGYAALWAVVDGEWQEIEGTQETWDCAILEQYEVPSGVAGEICYDYQAQQERDYQQS